MQIASHHKKQKVIVGLGKTGLSCAKYLASQKQMFKVVDSRMEPPGLEELKKQFPDVELELGEYKRETFLNAEVLIVSPGVDLRTPVLKESMAAGVPITGDINIFVKENTVPVVAITGSNAKSTVVSLLGEMAVKAGLNVGVGGNIGKPVLDFFAEKKCDLYVLELSSFQLETTSNLGAEVACVLNISPDHLDRYDSMQAYHKAKHRIFQGCKQIVVNRDDALSRPLIPDAVTQWNFGLSDSDINEFGLITKDNELYLAFNQKPLLALSKLKILGQHNAANALAALALGHAVGLPFPAMLNALTEFAGLPHRCEWVAEIHGIDYFNDSKGTNVGACVAAIEGLGEKRKIILIAGGAGKDGNFSALCRPLHKFAKLIILFGEDASLIAEAVKGHVAILQVEGLAEAVKVASEQAVTGNAVLMSPACASFDQYENYEQRGAAFINAVRELH